MLPQQQRALEPPPGVHRLPRSLQHRNRPRCRQYVTIYEPDAAQRTHRLLLLRPLRSSDPKGSFLLVTKVGGYHSPPELSCCFAKNNLAVTYEQERHRRLLGPCAAHEGAASCQGQTALTPTTLRSGGIRCRFSSRCRARPTQAPELACGRRTASGKSSGAGSSSCGASPGHVLQ